MRSHKNIIVLKMIVITCLLALGSCQHDPQVVPSDENQVTPNGEVEINPCDEGVVYFNKEIMPIMLVSCAYTGCHDAITAEDDVILDSYENIIRTGGVNAGDPQNSKLYEVLIDDPEDIMPPPPENALPQDQIDMIYNWIAQGAKNNSCDFCDTTVFSYALAVAPIVDLYCKGCHSGARPDGGVSLTNYDEVMASVDNGSFWGTITATNGFSIMPLSGSMPECEIGVIQKWIENGAQND